MNFNEDKIIENKNKASFNFKNYDFLLFEISLRLAERLDFIKKSFNDVLILGCYQGACSDVFANHSKIKNFKCVDNAFGMLKEGSNYVLCNKSNYFSAFKKESKDLVISSMFLHTSNNIKDVFQNMYNVLKKDSAILIAVPTVGTLKELEDAFMKADLETSNAFVTRVHPFLELKQTANLLQEVGFKEISSDREKLEVMYKDAKSLFKDLKGMGARNAFSSSKFIVNKTLLNKVTKALESKKEENGHFKITVEFSNFIAWK